MQPIARTSGISRAWQYCSEAVVVKLKFHGTDTDNDTDTDFLADFRARILAQKLACPARAEVG